MYKRQISKFAPIIVIPIYISFIGIDGFGVLDLYVTIGLAIFIVFEMQVVSGVMRSYYESQKNGTFRELIGSAFKLYYISYSVLLILLLFSWLLGFEFELISIEYLLPLIFAILPRQFFSLYTIVLRMEHRTKEYLAVNVANVFLVAVSGVIALYIYDFKVISILYGLSLIHI